MGDSEFLALECRQVFEMQGPSGAELVRGLSQQHTWPELHAAKQAQVIAIVESAVALTRAEAGPSIAGSNLQILAQRACIAEVSRVYCWQPPDVVGRPVEQEAIEIDVTDAEVIVTLGQVCAATPEGLTIFAGLALRSEQFRNENILAERDFLVREKISPIQPDSRKRDQRAIPVELDLPSRRSVAGNRRLAKIGAAPGRIAINAEAEARIGVIDQVRARLVDVAEAVAVHAGKHRFLRR